MKIEVKENIIIFFNEPMTFEIQLSLEHIIFIKIDNKKICYLGKNSMSWEKIPFDLFRMKPREFPDFLKKVLNILIERQISFSINCEHNYPSTSNEEEEYNLETLS